MKLLPKKEHQYIGARMNFIELNLIESARRGDSHGLNRLFSQHQRYIFNLMLQLTGDVALADDLTQETFLMAFRKLHSFRCQASFRTWLSRIAINLFRLEFRRKTKHYSLCLEKITVPSHQDNPERVVIKSELQWCILHNLQQHLPNKYREVLVLRDLHHLSYKEISEILGWSVSKTKTCLHRARQMFRQQFVNNKCKAFADDYLCICEGMLEL
jgi:RNA polymerase sigma-70 factor (ECF subfamily)